MFSFAQEIYNPEKKPARNVLLSMCYSQAKLMRIAYLPYNPMVWNAENKMLLGICGYNIAQLTFPPGEMMLDGAMKCSLPC